LIADIFSHEATSQTQNQDDAEGVDIWLTPVRMRLKISIGEGGSIPAKSLAMRKSSKAEDKSQKTNRRQYQALTEVATLG